MPATLTPTGTYEVRLTDQNGYSVPGAVAGAVSGADVLATERRFLAAEAVQHAAAWADFGYRPARYGVQVFDLNGPQPRLVPVDF